MNWMPMKGMMCAHLVKMSQPRSGQPEEGQAPSCLNMYIKLLQQSIQSKSMNDHHNLTK